MHFALTWIDHDQDARDRMERILALFEERDTRDELGMGSIRDSFSDLFFPGTSTIQTRLRYFLLVPWVYRLLEEEGVPSHELPQKARELELDLGEALRRDEEAEGVFGARAGRRLRRLPSSVYWGGLGEWGIRLFDGSQSRYHAAVDDLYRLRRLERDYGTEDDVVATSRRALSWHPGLPEAPPGFPEEATLDLSLDEAEYLRERVKVHHPDSLLAELFLHAEPAETVFPWQHPDFGGFRREHQAALEHARLFSEVTHGASLLYNLLLAAKKKNEQLVEKYRRLLSSWEERLDRKEVDQWRLGGMWETVWDQNHTVTPAAQRFVEEWVAHVRAGPVDPDGEPGDVVRNREIRLKRARSRFRNDRALDQWGGASGIDPFNYRWPEVSTYFGDLHAGLQSS